MLIEQITEFELRGPGPPGRTCTPTTGYFYDKTKISMANLSVYYYLLLKCCTRQCTLNFLLPGLNHLQNSTSKFKILNVFLTQIASKTRIEQFNFFNWLSTVKNLVL